MEVLVVVPVAAVTLALDDEAVIVTVVVVAVVVAINVPVAVVTLALDDEAVVVVVAAVVAIDDEAPEYILRVFFSSIKLSLATSLLLLFFLAASSHFLMCVLQNSMLEKDGMSLRTSFATTFPCLNFTVLRFSLASQSLIPH